MVKIIKNINIDNSKERRTHFSIALDLEFLGWESGFYQRRPNKITSTALLSSFWQMHQGSTNTLKDWTSELTKATGKVISEQSLNERLDERAVNLAKRALEKALNLKTNKKTIKKKKKIYKKFLKLFNRIIIRDSTTQKVPNHLHEIFPSSHSKGEPTAMMRIQALFNFTEEKWENFQSR